MDYQFTTINFPQEKSFIVQYQRHEEYSVLHTVDSYELNLIKTGNGKRIVGNNISFFEDYDLFLVGPDLPHNRELSEADRINPPECLILYISESLANHALIQIKELESIHQLFSRAIRGVAFKGEGVKLIEQQIVQLADLKGSESFIALIKILKNLSEIKDQELLSLTPELTVSYYKDLDHIKVVYDYILHNMQETVTLNTAADLLHMAPGSFCRYFKKRTGKSFMQYVKDVRINLASKMLSGTEKPVAQICYESGYNNLANFNFYFKSIMKMTPSEYRKNFR